MNQNSIGIIVPPSNPTVEPELHRMIPSSIPTYVARLPRLSGGLQERIEQYRYELGKTAAIFSELRPTEVIAACTASSYGLGAEEDDALGMEIAAAAGATSAHTAAGALFCTLKALKATTLTILSPYPNWLTDRSVSFWSGCGFSVIDVKTIPGTGQIYDLSDSEVQTVLDVVLEERKGSSPAADAVVVTGTGAPSLAAIEKTTAIQSVPILSSNIASMWTALNQLGGEEMITSSPSVALRALDSHIRHPEDMR